ncbi:MAG: ABC transporter permease [Clostridia bacterium]|nr:ABC transporter permease [Clostridia bacterium]MBO5206779.1 ABC transporter permease [Clostridia bacterium]
MLAIYKREMRSYFTGAVGYAFLVIYLAAAGIVFSYTTLFSMSADVTSFFTLMLIFSAVMLPILTMKSFSEERKTKTEQLVLTAPVSIFSMVAGKFLAAYSMFAMAHVFSSLYCLLLLPYGNLKAAVMLGNMLALLLVGMVFVSVGLFVSSLTENQLAAAVGTIAIILLLLAVGLIGLFLPTTYWLRFVFDAVSIFTRFQNFTAGYFDIASVVYYLSVSAVFLYLTVRVYDRRRYN